MWVSDASVANDSSTWGSRCASGTASTRVSLMAVKDTCMSVDYTRTFGLPFSPSVRGCSLQATAGRNFQEKLTIPKKHWSSLGVVGQDTDLMGSM